MKFYRATVEQAPGVPESEYEVALMHMEIVFAMGEKTKLLPATVMLGTLRDLHITRFVTEPRIEYLGQPCIQPKCEAFFLHEFVLEPANGKPGHTGWYWPFGSENESNDVVIHDHRTKEQR